MTRCFNPLESQRGKLVRMGRTPAQLAEEFGCTAQSIANCVAQSQRGSGERQDGLNFRRALGA